MQHVLRRFGARPHVECPSSRCLLLCVVLVVAPATAAAQAPTNEVFGSDDFWSRNDERAPQCGGINDQDRDLTQQLYESRDPKANQQLAQQRAPVRAELLQCIAQALDTATPPEAEPPPVPVTGRPTAPPGVRSNPGLAHAEDDSKVLVGEPVRYNTATHEIEYSPEYIRFIHDLFSNYEVAVALAQEVGHHVQLQRRQTFDKTKAKDWELQADRLSGAYIAGMKRRRQ